MAIRAMLTKHGLKDKRDYTTLEGPLPAMPTMLLEKKVDLAPAVLPFALNPKLLANAKPLFTQAGATGKTDTIIMCARESFIKAHRAAMIDFMEDMPRGVHRYLNPKSHDAVAELAHELTKAPANRFGWVFTKNDDYRDPDMMPGLAALQRNVDTDQQLSFIRRHLDVKAHADLSLLKEATAPQKRGRQIIPYHYYI